MSVIMARLGLRGLSRSLACLAAPRAPACTAATAGAGGSGSSRVAAAAGLAAAAIGGGVALAECSGGGGAPTSDELAGAVTMDELIGNTDHLTATEGTITVNGLQVKWWRYENTAAGVPTRTPLVALHGGPAFTHNYILPLKLLADSGHPVIFYDQAGCGGSTFVADPAKDAPWLLTIPYYVTELQAVVDGLGLERYHLYGSSWGTCLAQEFAATKPSGLKSLVLDGALCDGQTYTQTQLRDVLSTMPTLTQKILANLERDKDYDSPRYRIIDAALGHHFTTRQVPRPECWYDCIKGQNPKIYVAMQGASEFTLGGELEHWTITERNGALRIPALVLMGEFDTMSTECHQTVVDSIPMAWPLVTIPRAAHCKLLDEPQLCVEAIARFLFTVEEIEATPE